MRIGVDARFLVAERTGVETYFQEILERLILLGGPEEYLLYGSHGLTPQLPPGKWRCVNGKGSAPWRRAHRLRQDHLDLFYSPVTSFPLAGVPRRVVTIHDLAWHGVPESYSALERLRQRRWTALAVSRTDRIVVVSDSTRADLESLFPDARKRTEVVSPGVDERFFASTGQEEEKRVRRRYGLDGRFVFTLSSFHPRKNLPVLVEAFERFREGTPERMLLLIGGRGGRDSAKLLARVQRSPYKDEIVLAGYVPREDLPGLYSAAELFVCASRAEGFGIPVVEAMACGTPVLVSNLPVFREVCGNAALTADPMDPSALADGIARSLREEDDRGARIQFGMERARRYRWEASAQKLRDLFRRLGEVSR